MFHDAVDEDAAPPPPLYARNGRGGAGAGGDDGGGGGGGFGGKQEGDDDDDDMPMGGGGHPPAGGDAANAGAGADDGLYDGATGAAPSFGALPEDDLEVSQEDAWAVVSAFFEEKGLVRQQLDSFNEFVSNTIQEVVDEAPEIVVRPERQHRPGGPLPGEEDGEGGAGAGGEDDEEEREIRVKFGQIFLSRPVATEPDGETSTLFPREARLRNLTYSAPMYVNVTQSEWRRRPLGASGRRAAGGDEEEEEEEDEPGVERDGDWVLVDRVEHPKLFLAKVPIMLRSAFCSLGDSAAGGGGFGEAELTELGECPYDQGGYFVINGSEKVLIAQERMAHNHVYVFRKSQPSKYLYVAECR
jgi:DNA-directed RNA polymerase II subunit RPB2